jgi:hypothetical protein
MKTITYRLPRLLTTLAASIALMTAAASAAAEEEPPLPSFGQSGQVAINDLVALRSGGFGFLNALSSAAYVSGAAPPPTASAIVGYAYNESMYYSRHIVSVGPSVDVFVVDRVSLGATVGFAYAWGTETSSFAGGPGPLEASAFRQASYTFGAAPRVGYVIPLDRGFSLWPHVGFSYTRSFGVKSIDDGFDSVVAGAVGTRWGFGADLGVVFRPTRHFFFNAAPELSVTYRNDESGEPGRTLSKSSDVNVRVGGSLNLGVLLGT